MGANSYTEKGCDVLIVPGGALFCECATQEQAFNVVSALNGRQPEPSRDKERLDWLQKHVFMFDAERNDAWVDDDGWDPLQAAYEGDLRTAIDKASRNDATRSPNET